MHGIVLTSQRVADLQQLHAGDAQAASFKTLEDSADQTALHSVRLENNECTFH